MDTRVIKGEAKKKKKKKKRGVGGGWGIKRQSTGLETIQLHEM